MDEENIGQESQPQEAGSAPEQVQSQDTGGQQYQPPAQQAPQQPQSPWGVMENFRRLPQFQGMDEQQIAQGLYQSMQREQAAVRHLSQYQQLLPHTQQYLADRPQYEEWLKTRNQQQAPPQPEKKAWWNPPEVREAYRQYLVKDENGREVISPDAPLDARHSLAEYQQYKADFAKKFLTNPEEALGPMVQELASKQAQEIVTKTLAKRDREEYVNRLERENADWLVDEQTDQVTPEGFLVHKYIEEGKQIGIQDVEKLWDYATKNTEREVLIGRYEEQKNQIAQLQSLVQNLLQGQQAAPPPPQQQALPAPPQQQALPSPQDVARQNMEYLRREASRSPSRSAGTTNTDPRAPRQKQSFEQMLEDNARRRGLI